MYKKPIKMNKKLPNLFIPGAAKSGTTTLHEMLHMHPEICMSFKKEPYYWIKDNFDSYTPNITEDYLNLFNEKLDAIYRGESSTAYMLFPNFIERIKTHKLDNSKFIFILRNPIDRAYSHYWYLKGIGSENLDFKNALLFDKNIEPSPSNRLEEGKFKHYFQYGLYGKWLSRFYENFDQNQIKVITFESLKEKPQEIVNDCFKFLGLNTIESIELKHANKTNIVIAPKLHKQLVRIATGKVKPLKPLNKLVPEKIKRKIKSNFSDKLTNISKTNKTYPTLDIESRDWLKHLYEEDYKLLKKVSKLSFEEWEDFNN